MTRREVLVTALPAFAMALLRVLDRLALRLAERSIDRPWTHEASARIDRAIAKREDQP